MDDKAERKLPEGDMKNERLSSLIDRALINRRNTDIEDSVKRALAEPKVFDAIKAGLKSKKGGFIVYFKKEGEVYLGDFVAENTKRLYETQQRITEFEEQRKKAGLYSAYLKEIGCSKEQQTTATIEEMHFTINAWKEFASCELEDYLAAYEEKTNAEHPLILLDEGVALLLKLESPELDEKTYRVFRSRGTHPSAFMRFAMPKDYMELYSLDKLSMNAVLVKGFHTSDDQDNLNLLAVQQTELLEDVGGELAYVIELEAIGAMVGEYLRDYYKKSKGVLNLQNKAVVWDSEIEKGLDIS